MKIEKIKICVAVAKVNFSCFIVVNLTGIHKTRTRLNSFVHFSGARDTTKNTLLKKTPRQ